MNVRPKEFWMTATLQGRRCLLEKRREAVELNQPDLLEQLLVASFRRPELTALLGITILKRSDQFASIAQLLLHKGADPDGVSGDRCPFVVQASDGECLEVIQLLVAAGCDVNKARASDGATALHRAAWRGSLTAVQLLVGAGVDCSRRDDHHRTPLLVACQGDEIEAAMALMPRSECVLNACDADLNSALHWAVAHANEKLVKGLLKSGADPDLQNMEGNSSLMLAAGLGFTNIVESLVNSGADLNLTNRESEHALLLAAKQRQWCSVKALVNAGSDVNISDDSQTSVIFHVLHDVELLESVIEHGADVDAETLSGEFPLARAGLKNDITAMRSLLAANCNPEVNHSEGRRLLQYAIYACKRSMVVLLYEYCVVNCCCMDWLKIYLADEALGAKCAQDEAVTQIVHWLNGQIIDNTLHTLKAQCRATVRKSIGSRKFKAKVGTLPIPVAIAAFIVNS